MGEVGERLAGWLRSVNLEPGATRKEAIESAAIELGKSTRSHEVLDLVLLAHGGQSADASARVAEALRKQDETWDVRPGDLEASLTAATAAASAMEGSPASAVPFALAAGSAAYSKLAPSVDELAELARVSLVVSSEALRARTPLPPPSADIRSAFKNVPELSGEQPASADVVAEIVRATRTASSRAAGATEKLIPAMNSRLEAAEEEINLLWWVFGEYSELARLDFRKLPEHSAACVSGLEFTSLLRRQCPLPSTRAILSRVLQRRSEKQITLSQAVPTTLEVVGEEWVPNVEGHTLLPFLSAAREFLDLHHDALWNESVMSRWRINPQQLVTNVDLAEQVNREMLLLQWSKDG